MKCDYTELPPDGRSGAWAVETFTISEDDAAFARIRAMCHPLEYVTAGTYKRLVRGREVIMSNTDMEMRTNRAIMHQARGNVLINGLGLGVVLAVILKKPEVKNVTVIERSPDVIRLISPHFKDPRLKIIEGCAFLHRPSRGERYEAVWHDIWDNICADNLPEMTRLKRKYGRISKWQGCWGEHECRR